MLIKNLEQKVKLAKTVTIGVLITTIIIIIAILYFASNQLQIARNTIYVLTSDATAISATANSKEVTKEIEYKKAVENYHDLFFNIVPDEKQIDYQMQKAMYLIDETGVQQYNNLKEKGYYTQIMSSSSVLSIQKDSVIVDIQNKKWKYFGRQRIDRKSTTVTRTLITEGSYIEVPRSEMNVHGFMITNWKTIENKDLEIIEKSQI